MPLSKKRNKARMRVIRATQILSQPVQPNKGDRLPKARAVLASAVQPKTDTLRSKSSPIKQQSNTRIPLYNWQVHRPGDKVIIDGQVVTVPEMDMDGDPLSTVSSTGRLVSHNLFQPSFQPDPKPEKKEKKRSKLISLRFTVLHYGLPTSC